MHSPSKAHTACFLDMPPGRTFSFTRLVLFSLVDRSQPGFSRVGRTPFLPSCAKVRFLGGLPEEERGKKKAACLRESSSAGFVLYFVSFDRLAPSNLSCWQQAGGLASGNVLIATFSTNAHKICFITSPRGSTQVRS